MVPYEQVAHRASTLKQQNKKHHTLGHRSKGQVASLSKGRVNKINAKKIQKVALSKLQRKNQIKQIVSYKKLETLNKKQSLGTKSTPPFLVTLVMLYQDDNSEKILDILEELYKNDSVRKGDEKSKTRSKQGILHIGCKNLKQRFSFFLPPQEDVLAILDATKVSDTVMFVWKYGEALDDEKENLLSYLKFQGMPSVIHLVSGEEDLSQKKKDRAEKELKVTISSHFNDCPKLYSLKKCREYGLSLLFWPIGSQKRNDINFRDRRMHMVGEEVAFVDKGSDGTMEVSGYVRGQNITANDLVHIPGWGDFQISHIYSVKDPHPLVKNTHFIKSNSGMEFEINEFPQIIDGFGTPDPQLQESLASTREVLEDIVECDKIIETNDDGENLNLEKIITRKIPKGVSDYQAAWYLDNDKESVNEYDDDDEDEVEEDAPKLANDNESIFNASENDDNETATTMTDAGNDYDDDYDPDYDLAELQKLKAAKEDLTFNDEVDTPMDVPAKVKFQNYRGLASFRTSPWIQNEDLPADYSRIFQFKDFRHVKKSVLKEKREGIMPGTYVKICLREVPRNLYNMYESHKYPIVLFSLLKHEQKMSVLNVVLKSNTSKHIDSVESGSKLIFYMGIRRFCNSPIFSEHTNGDKHKLARYFHPGQTLMATMYAPITYPPCPISIFQQVGMTKKQVLIATGSVYSVNPNRIIVERAILSGHPFKVNKKSAVIRYMFFNANDVNWFKPVELRTKWGKKGHIVEPLGTHGHMKCKFNGQLTSQDTVMMKLYKRVFPQWHYDPHVESPSLSVCSRQSPFQSNLTVTNLKEFIQGLEPKSKKRKNETQVVMNMLETMKLQQ